MNCHKVYRWLLFQSNFESLVVFCLFLYKMTSRNCLPHIFNVYITFTFFSILLFQVPFLISVFLWKLCTFIKVILKYVISCFFSFLFIIHNNIIMYSSQYEQQYCLRGLQAVLVLSVSFNASIVLTLCMHCKIPDKWNHL